MIIFLYLIRVNEWCIFFLFELFDIACISGLFLLVLYLSSSHLSQFFLSSPFLFVFACVRPVYFPQAVSQQRSGASSMEMRARVCDLLGKEPNRQARVVTFSHKRIKKVQHVNLQSKRFFSEELDRKVKLRVSTKGIKTINKLGGIDAAARKFKVNLKNF